MSLEQLKDECHKLIDKPWQDARPSRQKEIRTRTYRWIAMNLYISRNKAHVSLFTEKQCEKLISLLTDKYRYKLFLDFIHEHPKKQRSRKKR